MITQKVLEYFDGNLLEQVISDKGQVYVKKWAAANTWILTKTTTKRIEAYLNLRISLYDLMFEFNQDGLLFDDKSEEYKEVKIESLPPLYLCSKDAMHDTDLIDD